MSKPGQSGLLWVSIGLLISLNLFNSCQLDNLEQRAVEDSQRLKELEAALQRGGGIGASGASGAGASPRVPEAVDADPNNLLRAPSRPLVRAQTVQPGQTLRMQIGQDPYGLNPLIAPGADINEYAGYFGSTLARRDVSKPDQYVPDLALKVETDDRLRYRISLRRDAYWHKPVVDWASGRYAWMKGDGPDERRPFTADDVVFTLEIVQNPQVAGRVSSVRSYFEALESVKAIDPYTVEVTFREAQYTNLPSLLDLTILPRWLYQFDEDGQALDPATWGLKLNEHWYNQKAMGTGPFSFVAWEPGVRLEFARDPYYYGEAPAYDRLLMSVVKDQNAWPRKLKAGELDFTYLQPEQYKTEVLDAKGGPLLGNPHIKATDFDVLNYFYIGWNADKPQFSDKRVRRAMSLAFNRAAIVEKVFYGQGKVTSGPFGQQTACYDASIAPLPFDLSAAKALLDEAGWKDADGDGVREKLINGEQVPLRFTMLTFGGSSEYETLTSIYREDLLQIGVQMTPVPLEWSAMLKRMEEREFDAYTGAWVLSWEIDLMQIWHSKEADRPKSSNRVGFRNPEADRIAEALRSEFDEAKRVELCHAFHKLVHEEQPYTFFYQRSRSALYWDYMNDLEFSPIPPHRDVRLFSFQREASPAG